MENLVGWEFSLEFRIGEELFVASRSMNEPDDIVLNEKKIKNKGYIDFLKSKTLCFDSEAAPKNPSFRSLIPYFIRRGKAGYVSFDRPFTAPKPYQFLLSITHLLGLDVQKTVEKFDLKKALDENQALEKGFKKDSVIKEYFNNNKDADIDLLDLEEKVEDLKKKLDEYKIAEDYQETQADYELKKQEFIDRQNELF